MIQPGFSLRRWLLGAEVTVLNEFMPPPYGGGNQFLLGLLKQWKKLGVDYYANRIGLRTRHILFNSYNFNMGWLRQKAKNHRAPLRLLHRVDGPIGLYRGEGNSVDEQIAAINADLADVTVFQSEFSRRAHEDLGLTFKSVEVIRNTVDPDLFYRPQEIEPLAGRKIRLVASAWSNNERKGLRTFLWLDEWLGQPQIRERYEMTFVGRMKGQPKNIRMIDAQPSRELGEILRAQDIYIAASENDPCSNALLEGLATGLPAVFRRSGGHPELVGAGGLGFDQPKEIPALLEQLTSSQTEFDRFRQATRVDPFETVAGRYLALLTGSPKPL